MHSNKIFGLGLGLALATTGCGDDESNTTVGTNGTDGTATLTGATATDSDTAGTASASGTSGSGGTSAGSDSNSSGTSGATTGSASDSDTATTGNTTDSSGSGGTSGGSTGATSGTSGGSSGGSSGSSTGGTTGGSTGGVTATTSGTTGGTTGNTTNSTGNTTNTTGNTTTTGGGDCEAPGMHVVCDDTSDNPFHVLGLNCPGGANETVPINNEYFTSNDATAWGVGTQYGSHIDPMTNEPFWGPTEGEKLLVISSGTVPAANPQGVILNTFNSGNLSTSNGNPDGVGLPPPMSFQQGSNNGAGGTPFMNCDLVNDCSDTLDAQWGFGSDANDILTFGFEVDVPGGTNGYEFDFAWFSSEYPEWVGSSFNDMFIVWSTSETFTGNVTFVDDQPLTVTALAEYIFNNGFQGNDAELADTGFAGQTGFGCSEPAPYQFLNFANCPNAGGTGWFTALGSAMPLETFSLTFTIFDKSDTILDTLALVDNWRWDCQGCVPSEVDSCGIRPQ